jgi:hypothetical protein
MKQMTKLPESGWLRAREVLRQGERERFRQPGQV